MFEMLLDMYLSGMIDEAGLQKAVDKGWITPEQMQEIIDFANTEAMKAQAVESI